MTVWCRSSVVVSQSRIITFAPKMRAEDVMDPSDFKILLHERVPPRSCNQPPPPQPSSVHGMSRFLNISPSLPVNNSYGLC